MQYEKILARLSTARRLKQALGTNMFAGILGEQVQFCLTHLYKLQAREFVTLWLNLLKI